MTLERAKSLFRKSHSQQHMETPVSYVDPAAGGVYVAPGQAASGAPQPAMATGQEMAFQPDQGGDFVAQDVNFSSLFMPFVKNYVSNLSHNKSPTKLPYPPNFYYPASSLQHQMNLQLHHFDTLLRANTLPTPQERFLAVLKYTISTCSLTKFPYKPVIAFLGETAQSYTTFSDGVNPADTTFYIGEQVEKDPAACAFYINNPTRGVVHEGSVSLCPKFKQAHVHVEFQGQRRTILASPQGLWNEVYVGDVPDLNIRLLRMHTELGGQFNLTCQATGFAATVQFKDKPIFGGAKNAIHGKVTFQGREILHIEGSWDEVSFVVDPASKARYELFNRNTSPKQKVESLPVDRQLPTSGDREWAPLIDCLHRRDWEGAKVVKAQLDATHHERQAGFEAAGGFVAKVFAKGPDSLFYIRDPNMVLASAGNPTM